VSRYLVKDLIARLLYDGQVIDTKPEALETLKSESVKKLQEGYENPDGVLEALFAHADDWRSGYYAPILPDTLLPGDDARIRSSYGNSAVAGLFLNEIALRNQLAWHLTDAKKLYEEVIAIEDNPKNAVDGITLSREIGEIGPSWVKRETDPKVFDRRTRLCGYLRNYQKLLDCMMRHGEAAAVGKRIDAVDLAAPGR
jgi:hypothetical protein